MAASNSPAACSTISTMSWTPSTVGGSPFDLAAMMLTTRRASSGIGVVGRAVEAVEAAGERVLDPANLERHHAPIALDDLPRRNDVHVQRRVAVTVSVGPVRGALRRRLERSIVDHGNRAHLAHFAASCFLATEGFAHRPGDHHRWGPTTTSCGQAGRSINILYLIAGVKRNSAVIWPCFDFAISMPGVHQGIGRRKARPVAQLYGNRLT